MYSDEIIFREKHYYPFHRGITHVETLYLTLLDYVLRNRMSSIEFIRLFVDYAYDSVVKPEILRDIEIKRKFIEYLKKEFKTRFSEKLGDVCPNFENGEPIEQCIKFLTIPDHLRKLYTNEEIRSGKAQQEIFRICYKILYIACMAILRDLKLIR